MTLWKTIVRTSEGDEYRSSASVEKVWRDLNDAFRTTYKGGEFSRRAYDDYEIRPSDYEY
jgi:hypothetical protein